VNDHQILALGLGLQAPWELTEQRLDTAVSPHEQKQVIRNAATGETFGGDSCCEIEHLFYGLDATKNYYQQEPCVGGTKIVFKSDGEKTTFAKEVVPTLDTACFEVFRPMFEFIKSKCPAGAEGEEVAP
jgi:hypothetical protein